MKSTLIRQGSFFAVTLFSITFFSAVTLPSNLQANEVKQFICKVKTDGTIKPRLVNREKAIRLSRKLNLPPMEFRYDNDNDGYAPEIAAAPEDIAYACENPDQFVLPSDTPDCDDTNPAIYPGAFDVPDNGIDEDCDGTDATVQTECPLEVVNAHNTVHPWEAVLPENDREYSCTALYNGGDSRMGFYTDTFEISAFGSVDGMPTRGVVEYTYYRERCRSCEVGDEQERFEIRISPAQAEACAVFIGCQNF